jgi:auxin-responsive protein IAA
LISLSNFHNKNKTFVCLFFLTRQVKEKMTSVTDADRNNYNMINFEETELRLGLPGASDHGEVPVKNSCGKRGFSETANMDLKLNLSSTNDSVSSSSTIAANKGIEKTSTASIATAPPRAK